MGSEMCIRDRSCHKIVHYCDSIYKARHVARNGGCVAVAIGVARRPDDLKDAPVGHMVGVIAFDPPEPEPPTKRPWWKFW